jgi:diaminopimelate decarboxylase
MIVTLGNHAPHPWFTVADDVIVVGGRPITAIAHEIGRTPFYVYDSAVMSCKVAEFKAALPAEVHVHYAMKANPMPAVVWHMAARVDGIDVASMGELAVALEAGAKPEVISFAGPGKTPRELEAAIVAGVMLNVESELELRRLAQIAQRLGKRPRVAVRVNPDFELKASGMKMGGGPKQFGIDAERVPQVLREIGSLPCEFVGFHIFSGSQNLRAESIVEAQTKAVALAAELAKAAPAPVRVLNIGGGLGVPYFPGEQPIELAPIASNLRGLLEQVRASMPQARVVLELGRYLVAESGLYVCRVLDRKISRGQVFLITDGGLHHHLSASGNFGQVLRKNYPVLIANRVHGAERETVSVVGPLCTPLDLLADRMEMARADVDDLVAVLQSGAYGLSASPLGFLSHPPPAEIMV